MRPKVRQQSSLVPMAFFVTVSAGASARGRVPSRPIRLQIITIYPGEALHLEGTITSRLRGRRITHAYFLMAPASFVEYIFRLLCFPSVPSVKTVGDACGNESKALEAPMLYRQQPLLWTSPCFEAI
ncbi:hypothetical protein E1B28_006171 [Marasmius oreades]|uniref:Uncharacterized protein n=1 Tax=Marasmius oreades TaxID=181124 RepID=A0A9P7S5E0_9AGAR|nr:uncharacterized protein E1B28_006171 [Marasmius oreades]KAG7095422.1 hypothetical protein E1B28_006171 [Marasmius oreades]